MATSMQADVLVYPDAPVRLVVLSVEYPAVPASDGQVDLLRAALRGQFPLIAQKAEAHVTVQVGPSPAARQQVVSFPSFTTRDRRASVAVTPTQLVIETRQYEGFDWYVGLVEPALQAVAEVLGPDAVIAMGHRFIDEVHLPAGDVDLTRWFDPALAAMPNLIGPPPERWHAIVSFQTDPESQLTLRYGLLDAPIVPPLTGRPVPFATPVMGLDWDSRWTPAVAPEFDPGLVVDRLVNLYAPVRALFNRVCTDALRQRFASTEGDRP